MEQIRKNYELFNIEAHRKKPFKNSLSFKFFQQRMFVWSFPPYSLTINLLKKTMSLPL